MMITMTKNIWLGGLLLAGALAAGSAMAANNDEAHERFHAAMGECRTQLNLPAPVKGQHTKLTADQKTELKDCLGRQGVVMPKHHKRMAKKFRAEVKDCVAKSGVTMPPHVKGTRPVLDDSQKAAVKQCFQAVRTQHKTSGNS